MIFTKEMIKNPKHWITQDNILMIVGIITNLTQ